MGFTEEQVVQLASERELVASDIQDLLLQTVVQGQASEHPGVREHLLHGAGRRLSVLKRAIENVFQIFPPSATRPLEREALSNVQINLHAFVMNLYGIFDNWAWAFVLRHELSAEIDKRNVNLFKAKTSRHLSKPLRDYLSTGVEKWHEEYLKSFRDALAHRIPLYIPPAEFTPEEGDRYNQLESEKVTLIRTRGWERLEQVWTEQANLGRPSFVFMHAFVEENAPTPMLLHPQLLCDAKTVVEFGKLFYQYWHERLG